ncbi:MAG TPA: hypothetical protein VFV75_09560 [Candidatus Polarisedimenticolaceae bacterium]|nr:hypothetical protein [Candidatus Polarisedimenticolaceae bacterium]
MSAPRGVLLLLVAVLGASACNRAKEEAPAPPLSEAPAPAPMPPAVQPVAVVAVTLGSAVGSDKKVTTAVETFGPKDTIYASVDTQGTAPSASLMARWKYEDGQTVHEETQAIAPSGPATTEFHVSKPDGWPKGGYTVEILLDGVPVRTASFRVG